MEESPVMDGLFHGQSHTKIWINMDYLEVPGTPISVKQ